MDNQPTMSPGQLHQTTAPSGGRGIKKIILFFIILLFLTTAIVGGYWWWTKNKKAAVGQNATQQNVVVDKTPVVDPFPNDKDRDGITNEEEKKLGLNESEFDTDGDGLSDSLEIGTLHTSPTSTDTDGDGFSDGWEVVKGYNPTGSGKLVK